MTSHIETANGAARLVVVVPLIAAVMATFMSQARADQLGDVKKAVSALQQQVTIQQGLIADLQSQVTALKNQTANVRALDAYLSVNPPDTPNATARFNFN